MSERQERVSHNHRGREIPSYAVAALLLGLFLRVVVITSAPVHQSESIVPYFNDEASHLNHVLFLKTFLRTPSQRFSAREMHALDRGEVEYYQPPLYYLFASGALRIIPSVVFLRVLSLIFWLVGLWLVVLSLPDRRWRGPLLLAGGLLGAGMIPSTTINNDSLLALVVAGTFAFTARAAREKLSLAGLAILACLAALGVWTKLSAILLWPMVAVAAYYGTRRRKLLAAVGVILAAAWLTLPLWLVRLHFYGGLFSFESAAGEAIFHPREAIIASIYSMVFPWMELWGSYLVKLLALLFMLLLAASGIAFAVLLAGRNPTLEKRLAGVNGRTLLIWGAGAIPVIIGWAVYGIQYHQTDARLFLPAAPCLAVLLGWPLWTFSREKADLAGWGLTVLLAIPYLSWVIH